VSGAVGRLDGKIAIVSGGARGMGASHCRTMVVEGAQVVIGDVLEEEGITLAKELRDAASFVPLDVTEEASWSAAVAHAVETFGPPSVLVNNAGIVRIGLIPDMSKQDFEAVLAVNLVGVWLGMRAVGPVMMNADGGSIINVSSTAGLTGYPGISGYVASKWGVRGITKSAALEFGTRGVRVNSIHPGAVDTPMVVGANVSNGMWAAQPIPRIGRPAEVSALVVFLASDESSYCTGHEFVVDGGNLVGQAVPAGLP
jgi:3alpha(or 20beta)-hydroxysteroid dehydrogenase